VLIVQHFEVFKFVVEDGVRLALDVERGVGKWLAAQLRFHLFEVVVVDMAVAARPDEVAHFQIALLRQHVGQQRVACNVEGYAQKDVGAALVKLAAEFAVGHVELEEGVVL